MGFPKGSKNPQSRKQRDSKHQQNATSLKRSQTESETPAIAAKKLKLNTKRKRLSQDPPKRKRKIYSNRQHYNMKKHFVSTGKLAKGLEKSAFLAENFVSEKTYDGCATRQVSREMKALNKKQKEYKKSQEHILPVAHKLKFQGIENLGCAYCPLQDVEERDVHCEKCGKYFHKNCLKKSEKVNENKVLKTCRHCS